jgi:hypothetical protein
MGGRYAVTPPQAQSAPAQPCPSSDSAPLAFLPQRPADFPPPPFATLGRPARTGAAINVELRSVRTLSTQAKSIPSPPVATCPPWQSAAKIPLRDSACAAGERRTKRDEDAGRLNRSFAIWPTEDRVPRRARRRSTQLHNQSNNLRTNGFGPEGQACSSRAKGKAGKDAGSINSSAIHATEDTASRRLAAARAASGPTERTHSSNRKDST